jgi:hypothetical protein
MVPSVAVVQHLDLAVDALAHAQRVDDQGQVVVAESVQLRTGLVLEVGCVDPRTSSDMGQIAMVASLAVLSPQLQQPPRLPLGLPQDLHPTLAELPSHRGQLTHLQPQRHARG